MTATAHALVGGALAASSLNPALVIPLSAVSHPLLDLIPHWDFARNWMQKPKIKLFVESSADLVVGFILSYLIFGRNVNFFYFTVVILVSEMWDMAEAPYWFLHWRFPPFSWIYQFQHKMQGRAKAFPWGILTQVVAVLGIIYLLNFFK